MDIVTLLFAGLGIFALCWIIIQAIGIECEGRSVLTLIAVTIVGVILVYLVLMYGNRIEFVNKPCTTVSQTLVMHSSLSVQPNPVKASTNPVPAAPVQPNQGPAELQLNNGKVYLVQNGQAQLLPKSGNTTIVVQP